MNHHSQPVKVFLSRLNENWPITASQTPEDARKIFTAAQAAYPVDLSGIAETQKTIPCENSDLHLNIIRPDASGGSLPVFLFIHGGGWVLGDYPTHKRMVRHLVVLTGFAAIFINYTLSPEAKYPQALNEIHTAAKWIMEHGEEIGVDPDRIGILGNGSGANMAAAATLMAKANGGPEFKVQILICPMTQAPDPLLTGPSFTDPHFTAPFLTGPLMKWMWDQYTTDQAHRMEIYASPLQATTEQLRGLPPTLIQTAANDIVRDEGEAFGRALDDAGVSVTTVRYHGVIHDFAFWNGLADLPQTRSLILQAAAELKKYLA